MTRMLPLILAAALLTMPQGAAAEQNCKPNRATCANGHQCCSGFCGSNGQCATRPTTTTTSTTTTITTTSTTTTTMTARFIDNDDGTVTDDLTGLQWEKKTGTVGTGVNCAATTCSDPHDVNNKYEWSSSGSAPDGEAFTIFLNTHTEVQNVWQS